VSRPSASIESQSLAMLEISRLNVFLVPEDEAKVQDQAVVAAQRSLDLSVTRCKRGVTRYLEGSRRKSAALASEVTAVNILILGRRMANPGLLELSEGRWGRSSLPDRPERRGKIASLGQN
jgi:hypothetical protein